jgi:DNA polymerase IIIc chi subunit
MINLYLVNQSIEEVFLSIIKKISLEFSTKKCIVICNNESFARNISTKLWNSGTFYPHGCAGDPFIEYNPMWISWEESYPGGYEIGISLEERIFKDSEKYEKIFYITKNDKFEVENLNKKWIQTESGWV